jgi:hypothetical protein
MKEETMGKDNDKKGQGPKYFVNIEGTEHQWEDATITTEEIMELGGWEPNLGAIIIDLKTNTERTLSAGEIVEIKPGQGFARKVTFKRG